MTACLLAFSTDGIYSTKDQKPASGTLIAAVSLAILSPVFIIELGHIKHGYTQIVPLSGSLRHEATRTQAYRRPTATTGGNAGATNGALCAALAAAGITGGGLVTGGSGGRCGLWRLSGSQRWQR